MPAISMNAILVENAIRIWLELDNAQYRLGRHGSQTRKKAHKAWSGVLAAVKTCTADELNAINPAYHEHADVAMRHLGMK